MRKMSRQRARVVAMAGGVSVMSGLGPLLRQHHPRLQWLWLVFLVLMMIWVIVQMVRLQRDEGCK